MVTESTNVSTTNRSWKDLIFNLCVLGNGNSEEVKGGWGEKWHIQCPILVFDFTSGWISLQAAV